VVVGYQTLLARRSQLRLDAVDVVVPNFLHAEIGVAALDAGLDVLLEKPMAPTVEACDALIAAARRRDRVLTIGHEFRLSGQWGAMKRIIDAGEIGRPRYGNVSLFRFPYRRILAWRYDQRRVGSWIWRSRPLLRFCSGTEAGVIGARRRQLSSTRRAATTSQPCCAGRATSTRRRPRRCQFEPS
jgi:hypothetical protein